MNVEMIDAAQACCRSKRMLHGFIVLAAAFVVTACATGGPYQLDLMPAPDVYDDGAIDPFTDTDPIEKIPYSGILYATNRAPAVDEEGYYLNERGRVLRLGAARIELGKEGVTWEEARRISLAKNRTDKYPLKVTEVEEFGILDRSYNLFTDPAMVEAEPQRPGKEFASLVNEKLASSQRKDIYIYVHGYKVVFENPLLVGMELWHYLAYDGVAISYAWPSTPSKWAYFSDIETAAVAAHHFRIFLDYLAEETEAERIHIIGYSAGTRVVITTLFQLALERNDQDKSAFQESSRIGHVILVGSDFDRDLFGAYLLDGMLDVPTDLTVYLSDTDKALGMSRWMFRRERLGQMWRDRDIPGRTAELLSQTQDLIIIDVTDAEKSDTGNGHAYFRNSPWASSDILATLMYDLSPSERGLVRPEGWPVWSFPPDYIERLRTKLIEVNPDLGKGLGLSHTTAPAP